MACEPNQDAGATRSTAAVPGAARWWSTLASTVLIVAVAAGCIADRDSGDDLDPLLDATAAALASTVAIDTEGCGPQSDHGTGAVIDDGLIVTAAHVVAGASEVRVIGPGTDPMTAAVVHFDPDLDVAALRVDRSLGTAADLAVGPVGRDAPAIMGVTGEPSAGRVVASTRAVTVLRQVTIETTDITRSHEVSRPGFELAGAVEPGDSGAMVHTADGGIGIVWARSTRDADRAWVVAMPDVLVDPDERTELVEPVDSGSCP